MKIPMTLRSKNCWQKTNQLVLTKKTEIFKSKAGAPPEFMNFIFHFVERPYDLRLGTIHK